MRRILEKLLILLTIFVMIGLLVVQIAFAAIEGGITNSNIPQLTDIKDREVGGLDGAQTNEATYNHLGKPFGETKGDTTVVSVDPNYTANDMTYDELKNKLSIYDGDDDKSSDQDYVYNKFIGTNDKPTLSTNKGSLMAYLNNKDFEEEKIYLYKYDSYSTYSPNSSNRYRWQERYICTGYWALRYFSSFYCLKNGQDMGRYHGYIFKNHTDRVDVSDYISLPDNVYLSDTNYNPTFLTSKYKNEAPRNSSGKITNKSSDFGDYLDKVLDKTLFSGISGIGASDSSGAYEEQEEVRKTWIRSNVIYYQNETDLYQIDNGEGTYTTNVFAYATAFSQRSKTTYYDRKDNPDRGQMGLWGVVGRPTLLEILSNNTSSTESSIPDDGDNDTNISEERIKNAELWYAGVALDEYEELLTANISGNSVKKHEEAVKGTNSNLRNKPTVTINSESESSEFVDNGEKDKVGTVEDSTGTTIFKDAGKYYYKIGPFFMSDYALAEAKDNDVLKKEGNSEYTGKVKNFVEKYSGGGDSGNPLKYPKLLGGIVAGKVTFKNDAGISKDISFVDDNKTNIKVVYTDMKGNKTYDDSTLSSTNYTTFPEDYDYPYPNSTFYIVISKDLWESATEITGMNFEYRQTKAYGTGWVLTSKYTSTTWKIAPEITGCDEYYCEYCENDGLDRDESNWGDGTGEKVHIYYCGGDGYCGDCKGECEGHKYSDGRKNSNCKRNHHHKHDPYENYKDTGCYEAERRDSCSGEHSNTHSHKDSCYQDNDPTKDLKCTIHKEKDSCYKKGDLDCDGLYNGDGSYTPFKNKNNPGCYDYYTNEDYCEHGFEDGKHKKGNHWSNNNKYDNCDKKTFCDEHDHNNCYYGYWELSSGPHTVDGQPALAIHDSQVEVIKTTRESKFNVRLTTDVSIKKYIYDVEHIESDVLTNSGYDSTKEANSDRKTMSEESKEDNPIYVEYGDIITYYIDLENKQNKSVKVKIRDILPEKCQVLSIISDEDTEIKYTSVIDNYFVTDWIVVDKGIVSIEIKILVLDGNKDTLYQNIVDIISRNEGHKDYPSKTVTSVDYMRNDSDKTPGPVVNLAEINGETTKSSDWHKFNYYEVNTKKFISGYNQEITGQNNTNGFTTEKNLESTIIIEDAQDDKKESYTRYSYTEEEKENYPLSIEKDETLIYTILISNDSKNEKLKPATQVRPTIIEDTLQKGLTIVGGKKGITVLLYDKDGKNSPKEVDINSITEGKNKNGDTVYKIEMKNDFILNPGQYIVINIKVKVDASNMYLYSLKNTVILSKLTNINHNVEIPEINKTPDRIIDESLIEGSISSSEYVKMKDLVIAGTVWLDYDKDGKMDSNYSSKSVEQGDNSNSVTTESAMQGIVVKLYDEDENLIRTTKTDSNGKYTFGRDENLSWYDGIYSILGEPGDLRATESEQRIPKATNKDKNKNYQENSEYINYYIEYEYDGILYKATEIYGGKDSANNNYGTNNLSEDWTPSETAYLYDSNAYEFKDVREEFNEKYQVISKNNAQGTSNAELDFTKQGHNSYLNIDHSRIMTARSFILKDSEKSIDNTKLLWIYEENGTLPETEYLKYINLGLEEREDVDISLTKDVYEVKTTINGEEMTYTYNKNEGINGESENEHNYIYKDEYLLELYETDYKYRYEQYQYEAVREHKGEASELNVEVTYRIRINNNSAGDLPLNAKIHEIVDLYDVNFKKPIIGADGKSQVINIKQKQLNETYGIYELKNTEVPVVQAWYTDKDGIDKDLMLSDGSKYSNSEFEGTGYNSLYIIGMEDILIEEEGYLDIYVKYVLDKTADRTLKIGEIENIAQINAYSIWDENGKPTSIVEMDANAGNLIEDKENVYEDNVYKTILNIPVPIIDPSNPEGDETIRTISGKVWDDARTEITSDGQYYGDGIYDTSKSKPNDAQMNENVKAHFGLSETKDILLKNIQAEYVEIVGIPQYEGNNLKIGADGKPEVRYYEEKLDQSEVNSNYKQKVRTDENGAYKLEGFIPGYYIVRYTYGNTVNPSSFDPNEEVQQTMLIYNGQDYKSTQYTGVDEGEADPKTETEINNYYDKIIEEMQIPNNSDAMDDEIRRLETIAYSETIVNYKAEILQGLANGKVEALKDNVANTEEELKALTDNTYMYADTIKFYIKPERLEGSKEYSALEKVNYDDVRGKRAFFIENIDFAIEYRPEAQIEMSKELSAVTLTTSDGNELVRLALETKYDEFNKKYHVIKEDSIGLEYTQFISNEYDILYEEDLQGFMFINVDDDILQGSTIEVEYTFAAKNKSEIDRIGKELDELKDRAKATETQRRYVQLDGPGTLCDSVEIAKEENKFKKYVYTAAGTAANILYNNGYGMKKDTSEGLYRTQERKLVDYYGKYLGNFYYTGIVDTNNDVVSSLKFDKILDYLDTDLVYTGASSTRQTNWSSWTDENLKDIFVDIKSYVDINPDESIDDFRLLNPKEKSYVTYPIGGAIDLTTTPITSNLLVSVDDDKINPGLVKYLLPAVADLTENKEESTGTISLIASRVVASETETNDMEYENLAEVIQYTSQTGRRTNYLTTIGNSNPSDGEFEQAKKESDTSATETITLIPPTGLDRINRVVRDTVEVAGKGIGIGVIAVALVFGGFVLVKIIIKKIKKRAIK